MKGTTGDGSSAPDCALTQTVREKKGRVIYGESGRFGDGKGIYSSMVVKNLANHTLFFAMVVYCRRASGKQNGQNHPGVRIESVSPKSAQNQKRHKNTGEEKEAFDHLED